MLLLLLLLLLLVAGEGGLARLPGQRQLGRAEVWR
jgi:hypothetical protein